MITVANILLVQVGWFVCVLGAANGYPWAGPAYVVASLPVHAFLIHKSGRGRMPWLLILVAAVVGWLGDSALVLTEIMSFDSRANVGWLSPLWMVALWINFAATLPLSMRWFEGRYVAGAVFGLLGGPLAYWAGMRLEAVELSAPLAVSLAVVAVEWAAAMPILLFAQSVLESRSRVRGDAGTSDAERTDESVPSLTQSSSTPSQSITGGSP